MSKPVFFLLFFAGAGLWTLVQAQDLTLPYFNIALKKKVTVNATCGENLARKETYCKLVGYDSLLLTSSNEIVDGQVINLHLHFYKKIHVCNKCNYKGHPKSKETISKRFNKLKGSFKVNVNEFLFHCS